MTPGAVLGRVDALRQKRRISTTALISPSRAERHHAQVSLYLVRLFGAQAELAVNEQLAHLGVVL